MANLVERGAQLRAVGMTQLRTFRRLKREFPAAEHSELLNAANLGPSGITPLWATHGQALRPVICKRPPKGAPKQVVTANIEAKTLREGDWIEGVGLVDAVWPRGKVLVRIKDRSPKLYRPDENVVIRLEDDGKE